MSYVLTHREHEMGEQPFAEESFEDLGDAIMAAHVMIMRVIRSTEKVTELDIRVPSSDEPLTATYVVTYDDEFGGYSTDYIIEVRTIA